MGKLEVTMEHHEKRFEDLDKKFEQQDKLFDELFNQTKPIPVLLERTNVMNENISYLRKQKDVEIQNKRDEIKESSNDKTKLIYFILGRTVLPIAIGVLMYAIGAGKF